MCAEAFNPDEEDEDTEPRVVHPKTDVQRCRLQEACRDILLFKTLDQVGEQNISNSQMHKGIRRSSAQGGPSVGVSKFVSNGPAILRSVQRMLSHPRVINEGGRAP